MSEEQETHMLTGAYALGAVDDLEAARVRELLRTSPEAAAEVRRLVDRLRDRSSAGGERLAAIRALRCDD